MPKKGTTTKYKRRVGVNLGQLKKDGFAFDPPIPEDQFDGNVEALRQFKLEYKPDGTGRKKQMKGVLKNLETGRLYLADGERYREFTDDEYSYIVKEIGEAKQLGDVEKRIGKPYKERTSDDDDEEGFFLSDEPSDKYTLDGKEYIYESDGDEFYDVEEEEFVEPDSATNEDIIEELKDLRNERHGQSKFGKETFDYFSPSGKMRKFMWAGHDLDSGFNGVGTDMTLYIDELGEVYADEQIDSKTRLPYLGDDAVPIGEIVPSGSGKLIPDNVSDWTLRFTQHTRYSNLGNREQDKKYKNPYPQFDDDDDDEEPEISVEPIQLDDTEFYYDKENRFLFEADEYGETVPVGEMFYLSNYGSNHIFYATTKYNKLNPAAGNPIDGEEKTEPWSPQNPISLADYDKLRIKLGAGKTRLPDGTEREDEELDKPTRMDDVDVYRFYPSLDYAGTSDFIDFQYRLEDICWVLLQPTTFNPRHNPETGFPHIGNTTDDDIDKFGTIIAEEDKFFLESEETMDEYLAVGLRGMIGHRRVHFVNAIGDEETSIGHKIRIYSFPEKVLLNREYDEETDEMNQVVWDLLAISNEDMGFFDEINILTGEEADLDEFEGSTFFDEELRAEYMDYGVPYENSESENPFMPLPFKVSEPNKDIANKIGLDIFGVGVPFLGNLIGEDTEDKEAKIAYGQSLIDLDEETETALDILMEEILKEDLSENLLEEKARSKSKKPKMATFGADPSKVIKKKKSKKPLTEKQIAALARMREKAAEKRAAKKKAAGTKE